MRILPCRCCNCYRHKGKGPRHMLRLLSTGAAITECKVVLIWYSVSITTSTSEYSPATAAAVDSLRTFAAMTTEHRMQVCPLYDSLGRQLWPAEMDSGKEEAFRQPGRPAVHVSLRAEGRSFHTRGRQGEDLQCMSAFVQRAGVSIRAVDKKTTCSENAVLFH